MRLGDAMTRVEERVARAISSAPPERLERVMRSPARRAVLGTIFWQMPRHLDGKQARGLSAVVRWRITGRHDVDVYELELADGHCRARRGETEAEPTVTITVDGAEFLRLATGSSEPMNAYFAGKVGLGGDIMFAAKLMSLFRVPGNRSGTKPAAPTG